MRLHGERGGSVFTGKKTKRKKISSQLYPAVLCQKLYILQFFGTVEQFSNRVVRDPPLVKYRAQYEISWFFYPEFRRKKLFEYNIFKKKGSIIEDQIMHF